MIRLTFRSLWCVSSFTLLTSCGSRTGLVLDESNVATPDTGDGVDVVIPSDAGADTTDIGDEGPDVPLPIACVLTELEKPIQILQFPGQQADAPKLVTLEPGSSTSAAKVALSAFRSGGSSDIHDSIDLVRLSVGKVWPGEVKAETSPVMFGIGSHGWGEMARAPGGTDLVLGWHGDPSASGPLFRRFDVAAWAPRDYVFVATPGEAVLALAPGATVDRLDGFSGQGYAISWRKVTPGADSKTQPLVAVLNEAGNVVFGPLPLAQPEAYPGRTPSLTWTGSNYLAATSYQDCVVSTGPGPTIRCEPDSLIISNIYHRGDVWADDGIEVKSVMGAESGLTPGRPKMASFGGQVWVTWVEGLRDKKGLANIRVAQLDTSGNVVKAPSTVATGAFPKTPISISASALGVVLSWVSDGDVKLGPSAFGRSRVEVIHLSLDGEVRSRLGADSPMFASYGLAVTMAETAAPPSLVFAWSASSVSSPGYSVVYLSWSTCK